MGITKFPGFRAGVLGLSIACLLAAFVTPVTAGDTERRQAKRIHDRLAGVPPSESVLTDMENALVAGNDLAAAAIAMDNNAFYNVTLKNFATPWTNRDQTLFAPLNDYSATVIGMIRDGVAFNQLLSADLVYTGDPTLGLPTNFQTSNAHYIAMEAQGIDLKDNLVAVLQSDIYSFPDTAAAGVMTTRAAAEAFFSDGTNRRMLRFTLLNHLCTDLEQLKDTSRSPDRVRQDVSRSPGGDSRLFLNSCVGCHSGMDPMAQAFAYYNFDTGTQQLQFTPGSVQPKYLINENTFKYGFVTPDDSWDNYWRAGQNSLLGWDSGFPAGSGNGAQSLGTELANSEAFARCQVTKVFRTVCLREPGNDPDRSIIDSITASFKAGYNMKSVFAETAVYCKGD